MSNPIDDLPDFGEDFEETEVVRVREQAFVNDQRVAPEVVKLASDDDAIDTAVVSFFDVDYVRTGEQKPVYGERARERVQSRAPAAKMNFIRK